MMMKAPVPSLWKIPPAICGPDRAMEPPVLSARLPAGVVTAVPALKF